MGKVSNCLRNGSADHRRCGAGLICGRLTNRKGCSVFGRPSTSLPRKFKPSRADVDESEGDAVSYPPVLSATMRVAYCSDSSFWLDGHTRGAHLGESACVWLQVAGATPYRRRPETASRSLYTALKRFKWVAMPAQDDSCSTAVRLCCGFGCRE